VSSQKIIRGVTATLLVSLIAGLAIVAGIRVRQKRPAETENSNPGQAVLGENSSDALGVYNEFKISERVQGQLVFSLEALRTLGKSSGWHDIETVLLQLYGDHEKKGPLLTCRRASFNVDTKDAKLSGSIQVEFPDGTFLSTEVGSLLGGGRKFETESGVVFVGNGVVGSAGVAEYEMKRNILSLSEGVIVRGDSGDSLSVSELIYRENVGKVDFPQGGTMTFGGFSLEFGEGEVALEEGDGREPSRVFFKGGVRITGEHPETGQQFDAWCEVFEARKDSGDRWQVTLRSSGPWVRFMTLGGTDVAFEEIFAWAIHAVAGPEGLLNVRADGRVCLTTIPFEGPVRRAGADSLRVWFDRGAATDLELLDNVTLSGDGFDAEAHRARLDVETGKAMLHGNPTGARRVTIRSDRGKLTADQAILFKESGRIDVLGRVQGEMFEAQVLGAGGDPEETGTVHLAAEGLTVSEDGTLFELRDDARLWQGSRLLTADEIVYRPELQQLDARGHVKTTLPARAVDPEASATEDIVLSARSMVYEDHERRALYVGDVQFSDPDYRLFAGKLEIRMGEAGGIDTVVATGSVKIVERKTKQTLTGNTAIRDVSKGTVVLEGSPARAVDGAGNMLSGRSLTWNQASGRVTVAEETETIYRPEENAEPQSP